MKKISLLFCLIFMSFFMMGTKALNETEYINLENVTTINFFNKVSYSPRDIKEICSYDYCDYVKSQNKYEMLEIFQKGYLNSILDDEIKASLRIKGIKITRIYLNN